MKTWRGKQGVTLIEMLVTIAVLGLVMAGVYGVLASAYRSYNHSRAKIESQQNARIILDYLVYRLREVSGARSTNDPTQCTACHEPNSDDDAADNPHIPCTEDVSIPEKSPAILDIHKVSYPKFDAVHNIPDEFQNMTGNYIQFVADLLPIHGLSETFTDCDGSNGYPGNGNWDFQDDKKTNSRYDKGEAELLTDTNDNNKYDYFGETWTLELRKSSEGPYYELIESLDFSTLYPRTTKSDGRLLYDNSVYDLDDTDGVGYVQLPVAYGITGLRIEKVPRVLQPYPTGRAVSVQCADSSDSAKCHGSAGSPNIYNDATNMNYAQFLNTHDFWNVAGLSVEVSTTDTRGFYQQFTKLREFVNFRNIEINQ